MSAVEIPDPYDLTVSSNNLVRRQRIQKLVSLLAILSALFAVALLALVLGTVLYKGFSQIDAAFFTMNGIISIGFFAVVLGARLLAGGV